MSSEIDDLCAGNDFRERMLPSANGFQGGAPWWHGWVIMDAYLAGLKAGRAEKSPERRDLLAAIKARLDTGAPVAEVEAMEEVSLIRTKAGDAAKAELGRMLSAADEADSESDGDLGAPSTEHTGA